MNENIPASTICESLTPVYETETNVKMLNFSTMSCVMKVGTKYLWRITASDPTQSQIFRNDGKSEIFSFRYKNPPQPITGLKGKLIGSNYQFDWDANPAHTSYWGEYYNPQTGNTTEGEISRNQLKLNCDKENYTIKFRVRATCYGDRSRTSEFTDWVELTTPQRPKRDSNFVCGKVFPDREITNLELKTELQEGEILESKNGDTRYEIKTATREGDGSFKGYMYFIADCWGGAKILCEYWDLKVNTDNIALKISFESEDVPGFVTDPAEIKNYFDELILNANSLATDSRIRDTMPIPQRFDYLYYNDKNQLVAVVVNPDGSTSEQTVTLHTSPSQTIICDSYGDSLVISKKGQVMGIKEYRATGGNRALLNEYHRKTDSAGEWYVNFLKSDNQTFGFDKYETNKNKSLYPNLNADYDLRYKSVATNSKDQVFVTDFNKSDSIVFKDKYGVKFKLNNNNLLNFSSSATADTNYIYAYKGDKKVGKLMLKTYEPKTYDVVLVSVNGAKIPSKSEIENYLNNVYHVANVKFNIVTDELEISDLQSFSHGGSGIFTVYNSDQKRILEAYDNKLKDKIQYLFFIENVTETEGVGGYNPLGYQCGFIYNGANNRTIAHEIGHRLFSLHHPFSDSKQAGKTDNLMDYSFEEELYHYQWDSIQEIQKKWMKWRQDESEGESVEVHEVTRDEFYHRLYTNIGGICSDMGKTSYYRGLKNEALKKAFSISMKSVLFKETWVRYMNMKEDPLNKVSIFFIECCNGNGVDRADISTKIRDLNNYNYQSLNYFIRSNDTLSIFKRLSDYKRYSLVTEIHCYTDNNTILEMSLEDQIAEWVITIGHEFFIHERNCRYAKDWMEALHLENEDKKKEAIVKVLFSILNDKNADWDHLQFVRGRKILMENFYKELMKIIPDTPNDNCFIGKKHLEKAWHNQKNRYK